MSKNEAGAGYKCREGLIHKQTKSKTRDKSKMKAQSVVKNVADETLPMAGSKKKHQLRIKMMLHSP